MVGERVEKGACKLSRATTQLTRAKTIQTDTWKPARWVQDVCLLLKRLKKPERTHSGGSDRQSAVVAPPMKTHPRV